MSTSGSCARTACRWLSPNSHGLSHSRAQDRADRGKRLMKHPSSVSKPHVRKRDTRLTPEDKQQFMVQRAAKATVRRALFDAATPPRRRRECVTKQATTKTCLMHLFISRSKKKSFALYFVYKL